jgi:hypothetical protein
MADPREGEGVKGGVGSAATTPRPAAAPRQEVRGERRGSRGQYGCACGMDGAPGGEYRERERREAGCGEGGSGVGGKEKGRGRGGLGLGGAVVFYMGRLVVMGRWWARSVLLPRAHHLDSRQRDNFHQIKF